MKVMGTNEPQEHDKTEIRRTKQGLELGLLLAGSLLVGFSMGRWLAPLAAWIGPALVLRFARDHRVGSGFLLVFAAYMVAFLIGFGAMWEAAWGLALMAILAVAYALLWSLPVLADRLLVPLSRGFPGTFVFPLAATALEFLNIHTNPVGTWGATGSTQYGNLPLMQLASVTGMIGITFLMAWFASVANWAWEKRGRGGEVPRGLAVFGTVLAVVYFFGYVRLNLEPSRGTDATVRVAGITAKSTSLDDVLAIDVPSHRDAYFSETVREAEAGARVIVWPEISGVGLGTDEASLITRAQDVARQYGIYLAIPFFTFYADTGHEGGQLAENKLLLFDPTGAIVIEHVKYGGRVFEGYRIQGDGTLQTVETPFGVLSGAICYDLDYPTNIQQSGQNGTGLLLVPSKDWFEIDPVHSHMASFRAIENGMSLVRQTDTGLSIAFDPYGRVLAQTDFFGATDRTMVAQVPVKHVATVYTAFGRWSGWLCLAGFLFVAARAFIARRLAN